MKYYLIIDNGYDRDIQVYNSIGELYNNNKEYMLNNDNWYIIKGDNIVR